MDLDKVDSICKELERKRIDFDIASRMLAMLQPDDNGKVKKIRMVFACDNNSDYIVPTDSKFIREELAAFMKKVCDKYATKIKYVQDELREAVNEED